MFNTLLQDKRVRTELTKYESLHRQRASTMNRYKKIYNDFLDLFSGLKSAKKWYAEMRDTVQSLDKNVESFVNNRRSEGAQLLNQIEQERAASSAAQKSRQAELERERLRELMERMSVDPPPAVPAPIVSYQAAPSPPLAKQQLQQQQVPAYNPIHFSRNPGPRSPPPTQTTFGFRGASSPLPPHTPLSPSRRSHSISRCPCTFQHPCTSTSSTSSNRSRPP